VYFPSVLIAEHVAPPDTKTITNGSSKIAAATPQRVLLFWLCVGWEQKLWFPLFPS
jgi:hypothetical protein